MAPPSLKTYFFCLPHHCFAAPSSCSAWKATCAPGRPGCSSCRTSEQAQQAVGRCRASICLCLCRFLAAHSCRLTQVPSLLPVPLPRPLAQVLQTGSRKHSRTAREGRSGSCSQSLQPAWLAGSKLAGSPWRRNSSQRRAARCAAEKGGGSAGGTAVGEGCGLGAARLEVSVR